MLLATFGAGCAEDEVEAFPVCNLDVDLATHTAPAGQAVEVTGGPFTAPHDTTIQLGGIRADVLEVDRADCALCDSCVEVEPDCHACAPCPPCVDLCEPCTETTVFEVPDLAPGEVSLTFLNAFGGAGPLPFEIIRVAELADP